MARRTFVPGAHLAFDQKPPSPFVFTADQRRGKKFLRPTLKKVEEHTFRWDDGRHQCSHQNSESHSNTGAMVDSSCAVLSFLDGMYVSPYCAQTIVCPQHQTLIPCADLETHLKNHHRMALTRCQLSVSEIQDHLFHAFGISAAQSVESVAEAISSLRPSSPIPGLPEPDLCIQCPCCEQWYPTRRYGVGRLLTQHWRRNGPNGCMAWRKKEGSKVRPKDLPSKYASPLFVGVWGASKNGIRMVFSDDFQIPAIETYHRHLVSDPNGHDELDERDVRPSVPYVVPEYIQKFGWHPYVLGLGADHMTLVQLVALPSKYTAHSWREDSEGRRVETGLNVVYDFIRTYLSDANDLVNDMDGCVRSAITAG
jgi:hypothetical protein